MSSSITPRVPPRFDVAMALTRIDCQITRTLPYSLEDSSYVAFNSTKHPGSLVVGASRAARESIGGQVACRLALESFVEGALDCGQELAHTPPIPPIPPIPPTDAPALLL